MFLAYYMGRLDGCKIYTLDMRFSVDGSLFSLRHVDGAYGFGHLCMQDAAKVIKARVALYSESNNFNVMALSVK